MARYLRRLSLLVCSFWIGCALQREYTMGQPLKCLWQNDLQKCPVENLWSMSQDTHRGSNQEVMQPVWVVPNTVEVVKGGHPRWLVTPQVCAIRGKVPLQRHGPYGQACAVGGAVPRAQGIEPSVVVSEPPIDGLGGAVGLRTLLGRGAVSPTATHLQHPLGHRPPEVQRCPRGHPPQALGDRPCGRCL